MEHEMANPTERQPAHSAAPLSRAPEGPTSDFVGRLFGAAWRIVLYLGVLFTVDVGLSKLASLLLHDLGVHFSRAQGVKPVEELIIGQLLLLAAAIVAIGVVRLLD